MDYKAPLTGSYSVLLTVGDDLGLILLLWRPKFFSELTGLFVLKLIPALFGFAFEITISRLQTWSDGSQSTRHMVNSSQPKSI